MQVFISHSTVDRGFSRWLAGELVARGVPTWYDEWEIKVGDSIVEKINAGLAAADALIVVLSPASVASRWVSEELAAAMTSLIAHRRIQVLPLLKETCELPPLLSHRRYADFRSDPERGLAEVLEALTPLRRLCDRLTTLGEQHADVVARLRKDGADDTMKEDIVELFHVMEEAAYIRYELQLRSRGEHPHVVRHRFFEVLEALSNEGVDIRSETWNSLVRLRARCAHWSSGFRLTKIVVGEEFRARYGGSPESAFENAMHRLVHIMRLLTTAPECQAG